MNDTDAMVLVYQRNAFYRRLYYLAFAAYILSIAVIAILLAVLTYLYRHPTKPLFFATDNLGRLIHVVPVNMPNMTYDKVIEWTTNAVQAASSYDYLNYREQLQNSEKYFRLDGWNSYMRSIIASNNLVALHERSLIVLAKVIPPVVKKNEGYMQGAYAWRFCMNLLVTYMEPPYDAQHQFQNALVANVAVQRQPALQGDNGLAIVQLIEAFPTADNACQPQLQQMTPPELSAPPAPASS